MLAAAPSLSSARSVASAYAVESTVVPNIFAAITPVQQVVETSILEVDGGASLVREQVMTADTQLGLVSNSNTQDDITDTELEVTTPLAADSALSVASVIQYIQPLTHCQPASSDVAIPPAVATLEVQVSLDLPAITPSAELACSTAPSTVPSSTLIAADSQVSSPVPPEPLLNNATLATPRIRYGSPPSPANKRRKCGGRHMRPWAGMPNIVYHQGVNGTQGYWGPEGMYPYDNMLMHYGDKNQFTAYGT
ncbi:hypothetical protein GGI21_005991, partial [Coemansia aciculifera]